ncbi:MAG: CopG family transcriptional regulator [Gammaproteobacteria bacterium]|nr:CopG family transcriptional regulator [Gammaproteobacteria bacterium]
MGQVTIYLEKDIEQKMVDAAKSAHLSKSKWIAKLIQDKVANEWPQSVAELAGSWEDFPTIGEIRHDGGKDLDREGL